MRIGLIHAVPMAMGPVADAFAQLWPDAVLMNVLDDRLGLDRADADALTDAMSRRIAALGQYALASHCDGVLYTCSAFGAAIDAVAQDTNVPVLRPNEAMFAEAIALAENGPVGMVATFEPSVASMTAEFQAEVAARGARTTLRTVVADGAIDAARSGDHATHNRLVAAAARSLEGCRAIMLAHFSTATALPEVDRSVDVPVLASPSAAVRALRKRLGGDQPW